MNECIFDIV